MSGIYSISCSDDGRGYAELFKRTLAQYPGSNMQIAKAIAKEYPCPRKLIEAYRSCNSDPEREALLAKIVVKRGAGIAETERKIGPQLSKKIYQWTFGINA